MSWASLVLMGCDLLELRANIRPRNVHGGGGLQVQWWPSQVPTDVCAPPLNTSVFNGGSGEMPRSS